ncbi:hypothetical protein AAFF_G00395980 [Aldrovandia affinis]|uniref:Uncharacterized protein n=1 Tax=Aldrovandia affinis TaxID=143900 RepID=A0AAD7SDG9_9TELE|nr:hypothetical protein AAFF_G00395980 [Aldrovandia affinis]
MNRPATPTERDHVHARTNVNDPLSPGLGLPTGEHSHTSSAVTRGTWCSPTAHAAEEAGPRCNGVCNTYLGFEVKAPGLDWPSLLCYTPHWDAIYTRKSSGRTYR